MLRSLKRHALVVLLGTSMIASSLARADAMLSTDQDESDLSPSWEAMIGDTLIARPFLLAMTATGAVAFVITLPFSALGGNIKEAAANLVGEPAKETFLRCLGCTESQYNWRKQRQEKEDQRGIDATTNNY